jgi:hypothetical protein
MRLGRFPDTIPSRKERLIVDLSARNLRPQSIRSGGSRTRGRGDRMSGYFFFLLLLLTSVLCPNARFATPDVATKLRCLFLCKLKMSLGSF